MSQEFCKYLLLDVPIETDSQSTYFQLEKIVSREIPATCDHNHTCISPEFL